MNIGEKILFLRKEKNLTQEQLGEILNVSPAAVSKWETRNAYPDIELLPLLAKVFDVSIDFLFDYVLENKPSIEETLKLSGELMHQKKHQEAISLIKESLLRYPNNVDLIFLLAKNQMIIARFLKSHEQAKMLAEAKEGFEKVIKITNDSKLKFWSYHYLTTVAINNNELDLAEFYNKHLLLPKGINPFVSAIAIKTRRNDSDSIDYIQKSINMDIHSYSYKLSWLVNNLIKKEQYKQTEEEIKRFIELLIIYTSNNLEEFNLNVSELYETLAYIKALNEEYEESLHNLALSVKYVLDYQSIYNEIHHSNRLLEVINSSERRIYQKLDQNKLTNIVNQLT